MKQKNTNNENNIAIQHQRKRKKKKIKLAVTSTILIILAIVLMSTYYLLSRKEYNQYKEQAKVNYKVNLKENDFYDQNYLDENSAVVASLIQDIEVDFNYKMKFDVPQDYTYNYKIVAKTTVNENKKSNPIYETSEELINEPSTEANNKELNILENVSIDYNEYNEKINKFVNLYGLSNTTNTLELEMYVYVVNKYDGTQINKTSKVMNLSIPLTTKTVDVSIGSNVVQDNGKILVKENDYKNLEYVLAVGIALAVIGLGFLIRFVKYVLDTRSAETMYEQELKQIVFNYKSYIQKSNTEIDKSGYRVIQINTFNEILGLRDTMQTPILMHTEEGELRTEFIIMNDGILYLYVLGAKEIRNELRAKSAEKKKKNK